MSRINYNKSSQYLLLSLALPLMGKLLVSELYAIVDTFFVGRFLDRSALSALGLVFPLQRFLYSLPILVGVGTSTTLSRALGRGDDKVLGKIIFTGFMIILVLQSLFVGLAYTRSDQLMGFFGAEGQALTSSSLYLKYCALGSFFFALNSFISFILLSLGNTKISLVSLIMGTILNMILDPIFLGPLGFGLEGAAIASMISQIIGASYALFFFRCFLKKSKRSKRQTKGAPIKKTSSWSLLLLTCLDVCSFSIVYFLHSSGILSDQGRRSTTCSSSFS